MTRTRIPFNGILTDISDCGSTAQILKKTGLDWNMEKVPLYAEVEDGSFQVIEDKRAVVMSPWNSDLSANKVALGPVVGKNYSFIQWEQFINMAADFLPFGAKFEYAGSIKNGTKGIVQLDLPDAKFSIQREIGEPREFEAKICLRNGCDGLTSFFGGLLTQDIKCLNQLPGLLRSQKAFRYRHTGNSNQRVAQAQTIIANAIRAFDEERMNLETLERLEMTDENVGNFLILFLTGKENLVDAKEAVSKLEGRAKTTFENRMEYLLELFQYGTSNRGLSGLDMLSAVTEFYDQAAGSKADQQRLLADLRMQKLANRTDDAIQSFVHSRNDATEAYERSQAQKRVHSNHFGGTFEKAKHRARKLLTNMAR